MVTSFNHNTTNNYKNNKYGQFFPESYRNNTVKCLKDEYCEMSKKMIIVMCLKDEYCEVSKMKIRKCLNDEYCEVSKKMNIVKCLKDEYSEVSKR